MAKLRYEVVATLGEYQNSQGETKRRYQKCGVVFQGENGFSLKLETIPVSPEWNGFFSLFEPRQRDGQQSRASRDETQQAPQDLGEGDSIPF